jgi:hypothetical protein
MISRVMRNGGFRGYLRHEIVCMLIDGWLMATLLFGPCTYGRIER